VRVVLTLSWSSKILSNFLAIDPEFHALGNSVESVSSAPEGKRAGPLSLPPWERKYHAELIRRRRIAVGRRLVLSNTEAPPLAAVVALQSRPMSWRELRVRSTDEGYCSCSPYTDRLLSAAKSSLPLCRHRYVPGRTWVVVGVLTVIPRDHKVVFEIPVEVACGDEKSSNTAKELEGNLRTVRD